MKTVVFQGEVSADGKLRIDVPAEMPPGPVEGIVVVQAAQHRAPLPYDTLKGMLVGKLDPDLKIDAVLNELNEQRNLAHFSNGHVRHPRTELRRSR